MKGIWRICLISMIIALCFCLTGCEKAKTVQENENHQILIGFAQLGSESGWRNGNTESVKTAAKEYGIDLREENAYQSQEKQINAIRKFIYSHVDVIVFSPIVEEGWDEVLLEAREEGIPVIIEDRYIKTKPENGTLYAAYVGSDFYSEGVKAGEYLLKKLANLAADECLNVVELVGTWDSTPMLQRSEGFRATIASEERIQIIDSVSGDFMTTKGKEAVQEMLEKYGDRMDVLYSHNDGMMYGALEAIEEYGLTPGKDIIIISVDGEQNAIDLLKEGKVNCVVECTPMLGQYIMQLAKDLYEGKTVEQITYSTEQVFTEFDDLDHIGSRGY